MTLPTASRPGLTADPPHRPADSDDAVRAVGAPAEAVTLADLIAESGPLPADAALECVQRLAERLTATPAYSCAGLGPSDVLIDDDGGVWLRSPADGSAPDGSLPEGMDRLGHLLAFLATGEDRHLADGTTPGASELPAPVSAVAGRLFSRNGACYRSYAELARDAAQSRGAAPAVEPVAAKEALAEPEPPAAEPVERAGAEGAADSEETGPSLVGIGMIAAAVAGAIIAFFVWQAL